MYGGDLDGELPLHVGVQQPQAAVEVEAVVARQARQLLHLDHAFITQTTLNLHDVKYYATRPSKGVPEISEKTALPHPLSAENW